MQKMLSALCFLLASAVAAHATAELREGGKPPSPMRDPPEHDVAACKTMEGIRYLNEVRTRLRRSNKVAVAYTNAALKDAGCEHFASVDYVEAEVHYESVRVSGKLSLEVRYVRIIVLDRFGETFYAAPLAPFPIFRWEGILNESE